MNKINENGNNKATEITEAKTRFGRFLDSLNSRQRSAFVYHVCDEVGCDVSKINNVKAGSSSFKEIPSQKIILAWAIKISKNNNLTLNDLFSDEAQG